MGRFVSQMANKFRANQSVLHNNYMMTQGNWTVWHSSDGFWRYGEVSEPDRVKNGWHAGYYVIIVIIVYGMSIVMLIASRINRKHQKLLEDRQIDKYLKEFQVVKERSSRDSYRNLKKAIVAKLYRGGSGGGGADRSSNSSACPGGKSGGIYRCISKSVLPLSTLAFPSALSAASGGGDDVGTMNTISASRETLLTTKDRSRTEICLCNLYVIEEFEGEQKHGHSLPEKTTVRHVNELNKHRCPRTITPTRTDPAGRGSDQFNQLQHTCVTAEVNMPPSSSRSQRSPELAVRHSPIGETAADLITVDQYDLPIDERQRPGGTDRPQLQKTIGQIHKQDSLKVGQFFGDSLSVAYPKRNVVTPMQMHSPKRFLPKSRSPGGARENHAYGASIGHHPDEVAARRSSYSSSVSSRNTNPVQISSV